MFFICDISFLTDPLVNLFLNEPNLQLPMSIVRAHLKVGYIPTIMLHVYLINALGSLRKSHIS